MNTTMSLTLADAASGTGMLKSGILSAIKSCGLSGTRGEFGQLRIEAEELHRELTETRTQASLAEQRVAVLTAMLDDMREQRDRWQAQADRLSSVLTDQQRKAPQWWPWRRSTRDAARLQITHVRDTPSDLKSD
jgi:septal ring factor EnvC (AmiA/AmiB activator)